MLGDALLLVYPEEEFKLLEHSHGGCHLRDEPAQVRLACKQGHVAFFVGLEDAMRKMAGMVEKVKLVHLEMLKGEEAMALTLEHERELRN